MNFIFERYDRWAEDTMLRLNLNGIEVPNVHKHNLTCAKKRRKRKSKKHS